MKRPNLFIVGAAKCGTTSMHHYLSQHPQVFLSEPKEPRYFDVDLPSSPQWCVRDTAAYEELFANTDDYKIVGEASPSYLVSHVAADAIRRYNPNARILIMLRNPVDFMYSLHRQFIVSCNENIVDFREALAAESARAEGRHLPAEAHYPKQLLYRANARFSDQVLRYFDAFGRDHVKVILLEDLKSAPERVFRELCQFLCIDEQFTPDFTPQNQTSEKSLRNFGIRQFLKRNPALRKLYGIVPASMRKRLGDVAAVVNRSTVEANAPLDPELRKTLVAEFRPEIERLGTIIDRDLSGWVSDEA